MSKPESTPDAADKSLMHRSSEHPVEPLFLKRWSPRAFNRAPMPQSDLETILEAARWAPSSFNVQPWRFLYAHRETQAFERFLGLLLPFNAAWAEHASVLLFVVSDRMLEAGSSGAPSVSHSHSFDAGAAWALLALQATALGYHAHGMTGVDFARTAEELTVPDRFRLEAAVAIGRLGDPATLPEKLRAREYPSGRKALREIAFEGSFPAGPLT